MASLTMGRATVAASSGAVTVSRPVPRTKGSLGGAGAFASSPHLSSARATGSDRGRVVSVQAAASTATASQGADTWEAGPLEPRVRPTEVQQPYPGVWTFTQPWEISEGVDPALRASAIRLDNGKLMVLNPVAPTASLLQALQPLGKPDYIVCGNAGPEHVAFCPAFAEIFPEAQVYVVPGAEKTMEEVCGRAPANLNFLSPEALPEAWGADLEAAVAPLGTGLEFNFLLKKHKCLFVFDSMFEVQSEFLPDGFFSYWMGRFTAMSAGLYETIGPFPPLKEVSKANHEATAEWYNTLAAMDFDTVIGAHVGPGPYRNAKAKFLKNFAKYVDAKN